jgi:antitoxin (DNA-binding transcriptional repressor) of toxin-antitoxin stability system
VLGRQPAVDQDIRNRCCGPSYKGRAVARPPKRYHLEADLTKDIRSILRRVQTGAEVIIERDAQPVAVLRPIEPVRRKISECIALLPADSVATNDPDFARRSRGGYRGAPRAVGAAHLGLMLNSTAVVAAEREGRTPDNRSSPWRSKQAMTISLVQ